MLDKDPVTRYTTDEVKLHPWIAKSFKDSANRDENKFKEVIEDNSEYYDDKLLSNKKLIKGTGTAQFTITKNIRRASVARISEKNRRLSSRPDQIAKRLQNIPSLTGINIVQEDDVLDPENHTQNAIKNFRDPP
jgi:serine/threonine protein kinase